MTCTTCRGCFYPFPEADCMNSSFQHPMGPYPCKPHYPALRKNFTTPTAGTPAIIEVTDTSSLTQGQGILIGSTFYQITNILDSIRLEVRHNGVGASVGALIVAVHPAYGCYQYPIILAGKVVLDAVAAVEGLNITADTAIPLSVYTNLAQMTYGYLGPTTVNLQAEWLGNIDLTPYWIGLALPGNARVTSPKAAFTAYHDSGNGLVPAVATLGEGDYSGYVIVGPGANAQHVDGADQRFIVSGNYEILL